MGALPIFPRPPVTKFVINEERVDFQASPDTPLLWALRDWFELTGTKFGCGMAQCGACTVWVNGVATRSCVTPVSEVEGKSVTTIEGLKRMKVGDVVKAAWIEKDVVQCGYCQPGQIMSASALLTKNPRPTDADIDAAMSGNICRCGTYQRVREAIKLASANLSKGAAPAKVAPRRKS
jgi:isoquinoline 1-oxidoreductase alpha subunit